MNLNCQTLAFQPESILEITEHTNTGTTVHFFGNLTDALQFSNNSKYKCDFRWLD